MTRHKDRPNAALLVIDPQEGVLAPVPGREALVATIQSVLERARAEGAPVIWVQHSDDQLPQDSDAWQLVAELQPAEGEPLVHKHFGDAFADTDLEEQLAAAGAGSVIVVGAQTDACLRSTLHGALARGYDATLVADAHGTEDLREWGSPISPEDAVAYANLYWSFSKTHEATGAVVPAAELDFTPAPA